MAGGLEREWVPHGAQLLTTFSFAGNFHLVMAMPIVARSRIDISEAIVKAWIIVMGLLVLSVSSQSFAAGTPVARERGATPSGGGASSGQFGGGMWGGGGDAYTCSTGCSSSYRTGEDYCEALYKSTSDISALNSCSSRASETLRQCANSCVGN